MHFVITQKKVRYVWEKINVLLVCFNSVCSGQVNYWQRESSVLMTMGNGPAHPSGQYCKQCVFWLGLGSPGCQAAAGAERRGSGGLGAGQAWAGEFQCFCQLSSQAPERSHHSTEQSWQQAGRREDPTRGGQHKCMLPFASKYIPWGLFRKCGWGEEERNYP